MRSAGQRDSSTTRTQDESIKCFFWRYCWRLFFTKKAGTMPYTNTIIIIYFFTRKQKLDQVEYSSINTTMKFINRKSPKKAPKVQKRKTAISFTLSSLSCQRNSSSESSLSVGCRWAEYSAWHIQQYGTSIVQEIQIFLHIHSTMHSSCTYFMLPEHSHRANSGFSQPKQILHRWSSSPSLVSVVLMADGCFYIYQVRVVLQINYYELGGTCECMWRAIESGLENTILQCFSHNRIKQNNQLQQSIPQEIPSATQHLLTHQIHSFPILKPIYRLKSPYLVIEKEQAKCKLIKNQQEYTYEEVRVEQNLCF